LPPPVLAWYSAIKTGVGEGGLGTN